MKDKHSTNQDAGKQPAKTTTRRGTRNAGSNLDIQTAINLGIEHSSGHPYHIGRTKTHAKQFVNYMSSNHPQIVYYKQIQPLHLRGFVSWCQERELSPTTVRHYINPLRLASRYVEENMPDQYSPLFFRRIAPAARIAPKRFLTLDRLKACIDHAYKRRDHTAQYALIVCGLAGLRFEEAINLKAEDIRDDYTLWIEDSKNQYSRRLVPILKPVYSYAKMFLTFYGDSPFRSIETLSKALHRVLKRMYKETGDETYNLCMPRDCGRKTFWNVAALEGVQIEYLRAYCGHSQGSSVAEKNYLDLVPVDDDMPDYKTAKLARMRHEVTERLESVVAAAGIK